MQVCVMQGQFQRHRIAVAAHDRRLAGIKLARRFRQARLGGLARTNQHRLFGGIGHFQFRHAGHGAHAGGNGALERLLRRFSL